LLDHVRQPVLGSRFRAGPPRLRSNGKIPFLPIPLQCHDGFTQASQLCENSSLPGSLRYFFLSFLLLSLSPINRATSPPPPANSAASQKIPPMDPSSSSAPRNSPN